MKQGEIYRVLDDGEEPKTEQRIAHTEWGDDATPRWYVVVSRDDLNNGESVVGIPLSTTNLEEREGYKNHAILRKELNPGLLASCAAQAELIRLVGKWELDPTPMTRIVGAEFERVLSAIGYMVDAFVFRDVLDIPNDDEPTLW